MFKKPINRTPWEPELESKASHMSFKKNSQINIWLFLCSSEQAPPSLRADSRGGLADTAELGIRAVADGILADPAFIDGFVGALVAGIRRESDSLRCVVDAAVDRIHAEGQQVAWLELRGEPAPAEFLPERYGIVGELSAMLPAIVSRDVCAARINI